MCAVGVQHRTICEEGDSFREPYIAGHNALNAHARAVSIYRTKYKAEQRGVIGMTLNCDWAVVRGERDKKMSSDGGRAFFRLDFVSLCFAFFIFW